MGINHEKLIKCFLAGDVEGFSGTPRQPGNLRIEGDQLIHYNTPILERYNDKYILNNTRYSLQTGQLQKKIKDIIPEEKRINVKRVPPDIKGSLTNYFDM